MPTGLLKKLTHLLCEGGDSDLEVDSGRVAHCREVRTVDASVASSARAVCTWKPNQGIISECWCGVGVSLEEYRKLGAVGDDFWKLPRIQRFALLISSCTYCVILRGAFDVAHTST